MTFLSNFNSSIPDLDRNCNGQTPLNSADTWQSEAVTAFRASQEEYTRERWPRVWTAIQHDLATALRTEFAADSPLEGAGFEPSVPLVRPVPEWLENGARALCAWSAEMRAHP